MIKVIFISQSSSGTPAAIKDFIAKATAVSLLFFSSSLCFFLFSLFSFLFSSFSYVFFIFASGQQSRMQLAKLLLGINLIPRKMNLPRQFTTFSLSSLVGN